MNSEKIYQELNKRGYNASIIAEAINVLPQSVAVVIRTGKGSKRIAIAISAAMDKKLEDVFPFYREKANKKAHRQQRATGSGETGDMRDKETTGILPRIGIEHFTGIPGNPQGRGKIERLWQTITIPLNI